MRVNFETLQNYAYAASYRPCRSQRNLLKISRTNCLFCCQLYGRCQMRNDRSVGDTPLTILLLHIPSPSPLRFMSPTIAARLLGRLSVDILCPSTEKETSDIVMQSRVCGRHIKRASVASGKCGECIMTSFLMRHVHKNFNALPKGAINSSTASRSAASKLLGNWLLLLVTSQRTCPACHTWWLH